MKLWYLAWSLLAPHRFSFKPFTTAKAAIAVYESLWKIRNSSSFSILTSTSPLIAASCTITSTNYFVLRSGSAWTALTTDLVGRSQYHRHHQHNHQSKASCNNTSWDKENDKGSCFASLGPLGSSNSPGWSWRVDRRGRDSLSTTAPHGLRGMILSLSSWFYNSLLKYKNKGSLKALPFLPLGYLGWGGMRILVVLNCFFSYY